MITQTLDRLAALAAAHGQAERALRLTGAGDTEYERLGSPRRRAERDKLEAWLLPLRDVLGNDVVDAVRAQGRALELEDAIALALSSGEPDTPRPAAPVPVCEATVLTARERQVAALLAHGLTNRQIAEQLVITERTVATHIEHLLNKLGFASRHQVGAWVTEHGLLS